MKKDRMIEILKERTRLLEMQNEQLLVENERLENVIEMNSRVEKEGLEEVNQRLLFLQSKMTEYDALISECTQLKQTYTEAAKQMHRLTGKYKKDIHDVRRFPIELY